MLENPQSKLNKQSQQTGPDKAQDQANKDPGMATQPERKSVNVGKVDTKAPDTTLKSHPDSGEQTTQKVQGGDESGFAAMLKKKLMGQMSDGFGDANSKPDSEQKQPNKQKADSKQAPADQKPNKPKPKVGQPKMAKPSIPKASIPKMPKIPRSRF